PDTQKGLEDWKEDMVAWGRKHGRNAWFSEHTVMPLKPGTAPVNSGECFKCGKAGH
ncbi:hypothetical protein BT96DRAFT_780861, partial [Gymnopus androsaceus JB14]